MDLKFYCNKFVDYINRKNNLFLFFGSYIVDINISIYSVIRINKT